MIGVLKHTTATPAYFRCVLLEHRMQESPRRAKFLSALPRPATGRAHAYEVLAGNTSEKTTL